MNLRERLPGLVAVILLLGLVLATWWAVDYTQRAIPFEPPRRLTHEPDAWARAFFMLRTNPDGVAVNRLEGDTMRHYPDDDSSEIFQARAILAQVDAPAITATADVAVLDQNGERVTLRGNARVVRQSFAQTPAMQVDSAVLTLDIPTEVVSTAEPAVVVRGHSTLRGIGMEYNNQTQILQVQSVVDAHIASAEPRAENLSR